MKKITLLVLLICGFSINGQITINNTQTPAQLVQNVLIGAGVTPTNIKFNTSAASANLVRDQAARFDINFTPGNLGFPSNSKGVILTTGKATVALGPNDSTNLSDPTSVPVAGDPDLALLCGNTVRNVSVLEFDFVATGLVLNFDYVFGSEEYPEYVNSTFNDTFGFFLSGPGISGPYAGGATNIALVPSTNIPITINNVNNGYNNDGTCDNCAYYHNNSNIGVNPETATGPTVQYDGFTTVLRATSPLQCGETYHIKLAVGNVS
ncbi:MAG TPA: choice-of-anchor L domain-containing protein, partial [Flavobacterium sp.]|nr:choice-of-anchor L domain-containing protein [Flavobacterium sp.]